MPMSEHRKDTLFTPHAIMVAVVATVFATWPVFRLARDWPRLGDRFLISVYCELLFLVAAFGIGFLARLVQRSGGTAARGVWIYLLTLVPCAIILFQSQRPTYVLDPPVLIPITIAALALIPFALFAGRRLTRMPVSTAGVIAFHALLLAPILAPRDGSGEIPFTMGTRQAPALRVCNLQYDGLSLDLLDRYLGDGSLPHFEAFLARGSAGHLLPRVSELNPFIDSSSRGMRSPVIWTSINTGRNPYDHGILDFHSTRIRFLSDPIPFRLPFNSSSLPGRILGASNITANSSFVREPFVWEIAEAGGLLCGTLGAQVTSPPPPVAGYLVADNAQVVRKSDYWFPEDLMQPDELERFRQLSIDDEMSEWFGFTSDVDIDEPFTGGPRIDRYSHAVSRIFRKDYRLAELALSIAPRTMPDLLTLYFPGPDDVQHFFWMHSFEPDAPIDPEERARFEKVIPNYLRFLDYVLGEMQRIFDPATTVFVISSDHGLGSYDRHTSISQFIPSLGRERYPFNTGNHRRRGVFLLAGPGIKAGRRQEDAHEVDVTPTILHLLGLPIAEDMDGRVITESFESDFVRDYPQTGIPSYSPLRRSGDLWLEDSEAIRERLEALGYVD